VNAHGEHAAPAAAAAEDLAARLRARGLRLTAQRDQVLLAVRELGHGTPEQVNEAVPGADLTTVYRTLELLEDLGLVRHTHLGHGAPSYRPAEDDHIHIVCHECGRVVDVPRDLVDPLERRLRDERGFELDRFHLTIFGSCADCAREHAGEHHDREHHDREHHAGEER
jgi:Fur family ferric uptake transcriptional regulator